MLEPSFNELADLIRENQGIKADKPIGPDTQFERDLGITGDDGDELLEKVERAFDLQFTRESFELQPNEFLFHGEGIDVFGAIWRMFRRIPEPEFRSFTVGELHAAIEREIQHKSKAPRT